MGYTINQNLSHTMKINQYLFTILFCSVFYNVQAQFSLGVRGGYIRAWEEYGDVNLPPDAQIHVERIQFTTLAYYTINKYLSIGLEPGFAQRGAACIPGWNNGPGGFIGDTKFLLNYVELPLMIKGILPVLKQLHLQGKVGYGISRIVSASQETSFPGIDQAPVKSKLDFAVNPNLRKWDNGVYGSVGIAYNLGKNQLFAETVFYAASRDFDQMSTSQNRSIHIGIGYMRSF